MTITDLERRLTRLLALVEEHRFTQSISKNRGYFRQALRACRDALEAENSVEGKREIVRMRQTIQDRSLVFNAETDVLELVTKMKAEQWYPFLELPDQVGTYRQKATGITRRLVSNGLVTRRRGRDKSYEVMVSPSMQSLAKEELIARTKGPASA